ncbi:PEP-CTERM sorting domain-containing protein [Thalassotalea euphylliae]|uniref:PEP-CTERM sorting domain-containing protein n=2 Tax=Thalassotalea euphylliae TaxID=1655234 RepID=A0A3E0TP63_9GAMM|nr:PEP-CTERM sorting domain-containing protein [Thalassotalea euphylliae]
MAATTFASATQLVISSKNHNDSGHQFKWTSNDHNAFTVTSYGTTATVSGWSDTSGNVNRADHIIKRAKFLEEDDKGGWALTNRDEAGSKPDYCGSYGHSADNLGNCGFRDYDFFMIEFDKEVLLTGATFSWINNKVLDNNDKKHEVNEHEAVNMNEISYAALKNNHVDHSTFDHIKSSNSVGHGYAEIQKNSGYYSDINTNVHSRYWIISAFNSIFGSGANSHEGNDGFKLASLSFTTKTTSPPNSIPEPATFVLMLMALAGLASRKFSLK